MSVIDDYFKTVTPEQSRELERIRTIVYNAVPNTEDTISYGMPTITYKQKNLIHFSAFKDHMSIFPTVSPMEELKDKLKPYRTGKGTLQFTESTPIPESLIQELVLIRKKAIDEI